MTPVGELLVPRRLGTGFRWLLASSWISNLGDGLWLAAGPLLVASLTDEAWPVALAATLAWLPSLLFGLVAGVLADRLDRRKVVAVADGLRAVVLALLVVALAGGRVSVWLAVAVTGVLATAEVFADTTALALPPMLVAPDDLGTAQIRLQFGFLTLNHLAGPTAGAFLFATGRIWPFLAQAILVALGASLITRLVLPAHGRRAPDAAASAGGVRQVVHEIGEGFRWSVGHPAVRTLILTIFVFNITYGADWSVLVLYATRRLGLDAVGFGLLTTMSAIGGLLGSLGYGALLRRVRARDVLRVGLVIETLVHLALALTTSTAVAMAVLLVFGAHAMIWGTTSITLRQREVPTRLMGRVTGVYRVGTYGGLCLGSAIGGALAQHVGLLAPFWFAFAGSAVFVVLIWRALSHVTPGGPTATG